MEQQSEGIGRFFVWWLLSFPFCGASLCVWDRVVWGAVMDCTIIVAVEIRWINFFGNF